MERAPDSSTFPEPAALVAGLRRGDGAALDAAFSLYHDRLFRFLEALTVTAAARATPSL